jgi:hypothetical protein
MMFAECICPGQDGHAEQRRAHDFEAKGGGKKKRHGERGKEGKGASGRVDEI